jgi:hypothetical protein
MFWYKLMSRLFGTEYIYVKFGTGMCQIELHHTSDGVYLGEFCEHVWKLDMNTGVLTRDCETECYGLPIKWLPITPKTIEAYKKTQGKS